MLQKNQVVTLFIQDMTTEGFGVAKYQDEQIKDFIVFVNNTVPGDTALCKIIKITKNYAIGKVETLLKASDQRIVSDCAVFGKCGGCAFRHISYQDELKLKQTFVQNAFNKKDKQHSSLVQPIIASPQMDRYRNKAQLPFSENGRCGFFAKGSHRTIEQEDCLLNHPSFRPIITMVEQHVQKYGISCYNEKNGTGLMRHLCIRRAHKTGEIMVCLVINGSDIPHKTQLIDTLTQIAEIKSIYININTKNTNVIYGTKCVLLWGKETITDVLCGLTFRISPLSFYQINSPQAEQIYQYAKEAAQLRDDDILLDLYCGIGTIGLCMADRVKKVIGIEVVEQAVRNADANAQLNGIRHASFYLTQASQTAQILKNAAQGQPPTVIVADPPRKGLDENTIELIKNLFPSRFVYISCNPATLARDLNILSQSNNFRVECIQPFDMFPRTGHVECVARISKRTITSL